MWLLGGYNHVTLEQLQSRVQNLEQWSERVNMVLAQAIILDFSKIIERNPELVEWAAKYVNDHTTDSK